MLLQLDQAAAILSKSDEAQLPFRLEPTKFPGFYSTVEIKKDHECFYRTRLDCYGCGCAHDCFYCYAKGINTRYGNWDPNNPKVADIAEIEKRVRKIPPGTIIRMGGMSDCFQPIELKHKVTLETIKLLNYYRIGYLIGTKSPYVAYSPYLQIMDKYLAHIQITVTSLDPINTAKYEKAAPPEERIRAILTLQKHDFDVAIRLSPLIEDYMDFEILNRLGINSCVVEFLRVNSWIKSWMPMDGYNKYTEFSGNYRHLKLNEKERIIEQVKIPNLTVCEKHPEHYVIWKRDFNPNPNDCCNLRKTTLNHTVCENSDESRCDRCHNTACKQIQAEVSRLQNKSSIIIGGDQS